MKVNTFIDLLTDKFDTFRFDVWIVFYEKSEVMVITLSCKGCNKKIVSTESTGSIRELNKKTEGWSPLIVKRMEDCLKKDCCECWRLIRMQHPSSYKRELKEISEGSVNKEEYRVIR